MSLAQMEEGQQEEVNLAQMEAERLEVGRQEGGSLVQVVEKQEVWREGVSLASLEGRWGVGWEEAHSGGRQEEETHLEEEEVRIQEEEKKKVALTKEEKPQEAPVEVAMAAPPEAKLEAEREEKVRIVEQVEVKFREEELGVMLVPEEVMTLRSTVPEQAKLA